MCTPLVNYAKQDYFNKNPIAYHLTEDGGYTVEIFSAYEAWTTDQIYTLTISNNEAYALFLNRLQEMSAIETPVQVGTEDKLITLSTCSDMDS